MVYREYIGVHDQKQNMIHVIIHIYTHIYMKLGFAMLAVKLSCCRMGCVCPCTVGVETAVFTARNLGSSTGTGGGDRCTHTK